jgi:hypothetical protein
LRAKHFEDGPKRMKKLTERYKEWLVIRARNEAHRPRNKKVRKLSGRHTVSAWFGDRLENVVSEVAPIEPPNTICFALNSEESIEFIDGIRSNFISLRPDFNSKKQSFIIKNQNKGGMHRVNGYVNFSKIEYIGTSAALIITAEYDRIGKILNEVPPTINIKSWKQTVFQRLFEIGFFEILGHQKQVEDRYVTDGNIKTMKIISGSNANELSIVCDSILSLSDFIDESGPINDEVELAINNALSEAMINVSKHAYPDDYNFQVRHVGKWWATASANRETRELNVVIFDQGASIPITYPRKKLSQSAIDFLKQALRIEPKFEFQNDGAYIECAMKPGRSQTNQPNRGLGLPEMKDLIDICGNGSLRIISRGGECRYDRGKPMTRLSRPHSIGGTLIEWTLRLPGRDMDE